ncbi:MAG TPA: universal stress protein [Thermodesulfobacteriota bacterium]
MLERILHPTDLSPGAEHARREVVRLARANGADVIVLHVLEGIPDTSSIALPSRGWQPVRDARLDWVHDAVGAPAAMIRKAGIDARPMLRFGRPHEEIVDAAREAAADLIVMGASEPRGRRRRLGSGVVGRVIRSAPCPVLVVPRTGRAGTSAGE